MTSRPPLRMTHDIVRYMKTSAPALLPLFRSQHQLVLLGEIFLGPEPDLSIAELAHRTGIPGPTVSREVSRLANHGVVLTRKRGRLVLVQANKDLPWAVELRSILAQTIGPLGLLQEALSDLEGAEAVFIFGSWAERYRGEVGPFPQDVDVLVVGTVDRPRLHAACRLVEKSLRVEVNPAVVTREEWAARNPESFVDTVRSRALVVVFERDGRDLAAAS